MISAAETRAYTVTGCFLQIFTPRQWLISARVTRGGNPYIRVSEQHMQGETEKRIRIRFSPPFLRGEMKQNGKYRQQTDRVRRKKYNARNAC